MQSKSHVGAGLAVVLGFALLCLSAGLAAYPRSGVDFTPEGTQPGTLVIELESPGECGSCHGEFAPAAQQNFMPSPTWSGSMKANATRDPLFWAALDVANHDVPGVGDYCLRCHTPSGWLAGRVHKTGNPGQPFIEGQNGCSLQGGFSEPDFGGNDFSGITCNVCHRADPVGPHGELARRENANLWINDALSCETVNGSFFGPCRKGPYDYPPSSTPPPHGWEKSHFLGSSEFCGSCHNVTTPITSEGPLRTLILADGSDTGIPYPIERTFSEWRASAYADVILANGFGDAPRLIERGQSCQGCHMRNSEDPAARACTIGGYPNRSGDLPVHEFVGANSWIPRILRDIYPLLGREQAFNRTIAWAEEMLTQRSAELTLTLGEPPPDAGVLEARVRVTNKAGHKLPTGYAEGRRMWIHVQARDADGTLFWESGAYDAATGVLSEDPQIKIYELLQGQWNRNGNGSCDATDELGRKLFHFVLNDCVIRDNRIPPAGFRGGNDLEIRPTGYSYPETFPGSGVLVHWDDTTYQIEVPAGIPRPIQVSARLRFQIASREYIEFLRFQAVENDFPSENEMCDRNWSEGPAHRSRGVFMYELWEQFDRSPPVDMASAWQAVGEP